MAASAERLLSFPIPDSPHAYSKRDTILYALSVGLGSQPCDPLDQRFLNENCLEVLPTMGVVLGYPGFWLMDPASGVDWQRVLHGEQGLFLHKPIPAEASVVGRTRVVDLVDRGPNRGAMLYVERTVHDADNDECYCTLTQTMVLRGDGGCGGSGRPVPKPHLVPGRVPDLIGELRTSPRAALLYGLLGDRNPLHFDPATAAAAGFERPILHGLCTFGGVGYTLIKEACDADPTRLKAIHARFTSHVYPGETLRTEIWCGAETLSFRTIAVERNVVVIDNGRAELG